MKNLAILNFVEGTASKVGFSFKKRSPEILVFAGIIGVVTSAVMACKATTKIDEVKEKTKDKMDAVRATENDEEVDTKKATAIVAVQTGLELAKLYGPSIALGALSIGAILTSNNILRKRNAALAAAYATVLSDFNGYRSRVIDRFGEELDRQLRYNIKEVEVEETVTDEKGKEKKVKKKIEVADPTVGSPYMAYFTRSNIYWDNSELHMESFFKGRQAYFNDLLRVKKVLTLNTVRNELGLDDTGKAGMVVGWIYDPYNKGDEVGDNFVELTIKKVRIPMEDGVTYDDAYAIDFNVDGNIYDRL